MQDAQVFPTTSEENVLAQIKSGAGWFYWIAGLSLVNSILTLSDSYYGFPLGLGVTLFIDGIMHAAVNEGGPQFLKYIGLAVNLVVVAFWFGLGVVAGKSHGWAFLIGIFLYSLDSLLHLAVGSTLSFGFHIFALIFITRGYLGCRKLPKRTPATANDSPPPPPSFATS